MMTEKKINPKRRFFLAAAGVAPVLAATVALTKKEEVLATLPETQPESVSGVGYHETEHIRKYYFTAGYY